MQPKTKLVEQHNRWKPLGQQMQLNQKHSFGYDYYLISSGWFPDAVNQTINVTGQTITNTSVSVNFNRALNTNSSTDIPLNLTNAYSLLYTTSLGNVTNTSAPVTNITQTLSLTTGRISYAGLMGLALVVLAF